MWSNLKIKEITKIEKLVGEYNIWELNKSPYGKFKVKVFVDANNSFRGYTNIQVIDEMGDFYCAVGHGKTEAAALEDTIRQFLKMASRKAEWEERDFLCADSFDF